MMIKTKPLRTQIELRAWACEDACNGMGPARVRRSSRPGCLGVGLCHPARLKQHDVARSKTHHPTYEDTYRC